MTPVAVLEPVNLSGSVVSRASMYNFDEIKRLDISLYDEVLIKKAAEIIPKVVRSRKTPNSKPLELPNACPCCKTPLIDVEGEVAKYCPNQKNCKAQIKGRIEYFVSKQAMDIDGLGESIIDQLISKNYVYNFSDIYKITYENLLTLDLIQEKSAKNLLNAIEKSKNVLFQKFINALGIRLVGKESSDILAQNYKDIEALKNATFEDLSLIDGIGEKMAKSIVQYFKNKDNIFVIDEMLRLGLKIENKYTKNVDLRLKGKSFVITGTLDAMSRDEAQAKLKELGAKTPSSVSKNTSYVIVGQNAGSKAQKAQALGIEILSEEDLIKILKGE